MKRTLLGRTWLSHFNTLLGILLFCCCGYASPSQLTYQGRILKSDGTPLENSSVSFLFQILDPSGQCLVYQEEVTGINMVNSGGVFDVAIGLGSVQFPTGGGSTILDAFNNTSTFTCGTCSSSGASYTCANSSSTYTASMSDGRKLRVSFYDGTGWQTISPDNVIRSVPFAGYSLSAQKLGTNVASDFLLKAGLPTCASGSFLTWNGSAFSCAAVSGASGGTVTNVTSTSAYLSVANGTTTPALTVNVGTTANTVAAGNDTRIVNALQAGSSAGGDLSGNYPNPQVSALQGVALSSAIPSSGQVLKYNGTNWAASSLTASDVSGLSTTYLTQSAFSGYVSSAGCSTSQTMYWNSVSGNFQCQAINVGLAGDVTGSIGSAKVVALQNQPVDTTVPTSNQVLQWNGSKWAPTTLPTGNVGTVTSVSGTAPINVATGTSTPVISISQATSSTNGYLSSADWTTFNNKQGAGNYLTALTGDVTASGPGSAAATIAKLQGSTLTITTPASGDYVRYNGSAFINSPLQASDLNGTLPVSSLPAFTGDVTSSAGSTTLALAATGTAGTYYKVTTDSKGRVTSGSTSLSASDIPNLDWSKITTGKPTTLSGYGITDSVKNNGGTPSIQTGGDASKPASPSAGAIYFATDTNTIYQYNSSAWAVIASASGSGGTITALTSDVSASGSGSVAATVNSVGGSTAANIHTAEVLANAATNANTASTIVKRDASGNFSAGTITASLTGAASLNVLKAGDSMSGNLTFGANLGNIYTAGSGANTVAVEGPSTAITTSYVLRLPTAQGAANQLMINDGSGNLSWTSLSSLGVASVSVSSPITNSGSASAPNIGIQQATTSQSGYLSNADWNTFNNKQSTSLTSANIWVGNGSNVAAAVAPSGDVSMTNAGAFTVAKLQGTAVSATVPSSTGQVLRWNGTNWTPNFVSMFDLRSTVTGTQAFGGVGCTAGQTLTWTAATDNLSCTNIAVSSSQVTFPSQTANTFFAAPNGSAGTPTFRNIASTDLPASGVTAGTYKSVTVDTYGRVTAGTNPNTVAGYGITDAFVNGGNSFGASANLGTNDGNTLNFKTNNSTRMTIDTSGNVAIGLTSPWDQFDVYRANASAGASIISDNTSGNTARYPYLNVTNYMGSPSNGAGGNPGINLVNMRGNSSTSAAMQSGESLGAITFNGSNGTTGNYNEGAAIWATTTQAYTGSAGGTSLSFYTTPNGSVTAQPRMTIDQTGYTGIGTTTPTLPLYIYGGAVLQSGQANMGLDSSSGYAGLMLLNAGTSRWIVRDEASTDNLNFWRQSGTSGSPVWATAMTIQNSSGNVGIGTASPGAKLAIGGTAGTDGLMYPDGTKQTSATGNVSLKYTANSSTSLPSGAFTPVTFGAKVWDKTSSFNGTAFTAPAAGTYQVSSCIWLGSVVASLELDAYVNGIRSTGLGGSTTSGPACGTTLVQLNANDTLSIYAYHASGSTLSVQANNAFWCWLTIHRLSD